MCETKTVQVNGRHVLLRVGPRYTGRNIQVLIQAGVNRARATGIGRAVARSTSGTKRLTQ